MLKTVYKSFPIWSYEKQEKWLSEMSKKGLHLFYVGYLNKYVFEQGECGEFIYKIEMLDKYPFKVKEKYYIEYLKNTGVEYICSLNQWIFIRKRITDGNFESFIDTKTNLIRYLKRYNKLNIVLLIPNFLLAMIRLFKHQKEGYILDMMILNILLLLVSIFLGFVIYKVSRIIRKLQKERDISR